jgi:catechol 2,3-dioxygenase-like lactoylglutathione lyase family enzyme
MTETATEQLTTPFEYDRQLVISVNVSSFDAAVDWYRTALGFELVYRLDQFGWGEIRTPWGG